MMHKLKNKSWQEYINVLIVLLVLALPLLIITSIFVNQKLIYLALLICIGIPVIDYFYRKCGGKGLNEHEGSK